MVTEKQIIATLLRRLCCYRHQWSDLDREAQTEAVTWLRAREGGECWSPNAGGVCDNCGEPRFAHGEDAECPGDGDCERLRDRLDGWHALVRPAREAYQAARKREQKARDRRPAEQQQAAAAEADRLWGAYQAAIRRADRESWEKHV